MSFHSADTKPLSPPVGRPDCARRFLRDPFGFATALRAHRLYSTLAALDNARLGALGLNRRELPATALRAARGGRSDL